MSSVKDTGYKKMECGDMHHQNKTILSDTGAGFVNLQVVGTDPFQTGVKTGASITALTGDYARQAGKSERNGFCRKRM